MQKLHINEPYFSAYKKFGWADKTPGLGFDQGLIDKLASDSLSLEVTVGKDPQKYTVSARTIQHFAQTNNTLYMARFNNPLYVVPITKLVKLTD